MAELSYRAAVAAGMRQEIERDDRVVVLGEDVAKAGGVFKTTKGLLDEFGPTRIWDTPISEQAILGSALGAAMTGMRPVAEVMFSDFFAVCWDYIANEISKMHYMTGGQASAPLVIYTANGAGLRFGAQHSQAVESWAMCVPGLKLISPSTPADMKGLMAAAIRDDDPTIVFGAKRLLPTKGDVPEGEHVVPLGRAAVRHEGGDVTIVALGATVPTAIKAAESLSQEGVAATVLDLRCLIPLDAASVLESVQRTGRLVIVEEAPPQLSWGASVSALVAEEAFGDLRSPIRRVSSANVPIPSSPFLEDLALPRHEQVIDTVRRLVAAS